ncbi:MAG TPA: TolC family protein [Phycisphaerales bacterium]|nr:TolC family protein [Phycisphaerales bacterium]
MTVTTKDYWPNPRRFAGCACAALLAAVSGCQSYEPRALDVDATRRAFTERDPGSESVRAFAHRLAQGEHGPQAPSGFDPTDGLTLAEAEPVALVFNRELRLARLELGVAAAAAEHASRWTDPVLGVDVERIVSGVPHPWVVLGSVGLTLPVSGRLAAEQARANAEHAAELGRVAAKEWATRSTLRELWIEWSAQAERSRIAASLIGRLGEFATLAARHEEAGILSRMDERLFRVELASAEAAAAEAKGRVRELELQLRDVMGLAPTAPVRLVESVAFSPRITDAAALQAAIESDNPELNAVRRAYAAAEESLRAEVRSQYPDLEIGPGYGTDEGDERVLLGVRLPLPLWNANRGGIARAQAQRDAARARFEGTYERLLSQQAVALNRLNAARELREAVEGRLLPLADEQETDARRVVELGRVDPLMLLNALRSQQETKGLLLNARAAESIGAVRLDELLGPPTPRTAEGAGPDGRPRLEGDRQ